MVITLKTLKASFLRLEFVIAVISFSLMYAIHFLGDLSLGGALWLHMIPEMFGLYVLGYWVFDEGFSWKMVLLSYLFVSLITPVVVGSNPYLAGLFIGSVIGASLLIGYYNATRNSII